jgi:hypothetical protein
MNVPLHRRTFLHASGVGLALPFLEAMNPALGRQSQPPPKRMVTICTALGLHGPALYPKTTGTGYESTEYLDLLKAHRKQFTLFSGLSHPDQGGEHSTELSFLSAARNPEQAGFRNSVSIDQHAAGALGYVTRFPSVILSSNGPKSQSYTRGGVMVPAEHRPARMFAKMFLKGSPDEVRRIKRHLAEGRSILDELKTQTKSLQTKTSTADRRRLEEYFEAVRAAEKDLVAAQAWLKKPKPTVKQVQPADIVDKTDLVGRAKLLMNLVPLILQTDTSRVISITIQDHHVVPQVSGVSLEHHNLSHHGRDQKKIVQLKKIEKTLLSCYGDLIGQLKGLTEGSGTLLDHTSVLFGSNLGNANAHDPRNLPILLAGGGFKHGKYVAHNRKNNTPLCNLYLSMLHKMGVESKSFATSTGTINL